MGNILISLIHTLNSGFRTRTVLLAEILALRHQLAILKQSAKKRIAEIADRFKNLPQIRAAE